MRKLLAVCALALAAPSIIAGCGGDDDEDPEELLRQALGEETQFESGVINIGLDGSLEGTQSGTIDATVSGPFHSAEGEPLELALTADASVSAEGIPQVPGGGSVSFDFEGGFGLADDTLFVNYQGTDYEASQELYSTIKPLLESASEVSETTEDPESTDAFIDSLSNLENEGTEDLEGESAVHLSGDFDFAALAEQAESAAVPFDTAQLEGFNATLDVFVAEEDSSFRRIDFGFSADEVESLSAAGVEGLSFTISVGISEPNVEQTIEAPADTEPLDDLLREFDTSEAEISQLLESGLTVPGGAGIPGLGGGSAIPDLGGGTGDTGGGSADLEALGECLNEAGQDQAAIEACLQ